MLDGQLDSKTSLLGSLVTAANNPENSSYILLLIFEFQLTILLSFFSTSAIVSFLRLKTNLMTKQTKQSSWRVKLESLVGKSS